MMQAQNAELAREDFVVFSRSPSEWKAVTLAMQSIAEDVTFEVDADGIRSRAMDPSHVALLDISLTSKSFERYTCSKPTKFTLHLEDFLKIVKRADQKDTFEISRSEGRGLSIRMGSGSYKKEFELHLIENHLKSSPLPRLNFTTRFKLDLNSFQQILMDVSTLSSYLNVVVRSDSVTLSGKGDSGKVEIVLGKNSSGLLQEVELLGDLNETKALYNMEYMLKLVKAVAPYSDLVTFEYANKMPLKLEFNIGENQGIGKIQYYLAPKITD
ncbi:MAG: proliferating cell nuclear antigen (pcna) [Thaumarchaeota archaeon]|nr:proliferating cell nuclear antigen (pcna) [Nitrososphaerota archaeon]